MESVMVVSSIVGDSTQGKSKLQGARTMRFEVILSQNHSICQGRVIVSIANLQVQGDVKDHTTMVACMSQRIVFQHRWKQLLNEK